MTLSSGTNEVQGSVMFHLKVNTGFCSKHSSAVAGAAFACLTSALTFQSITEHS